MRYQVDFTHIKTGEKKSLFVTLSPDEVAQAESVELSEFTRQAHVIRHACRALPTEFVLNATHEEPRRAPRN